MRALAAFILIAILLLVGCRNESERSAMARAPRPEDSESPEGSLESAVADSPAARLRRLWSGSDYNFFASSPSPDGRYVTEIDWSTGDLAVRDLVTGRLHRLTDKGPWETSADFAEVARFSPDGRRIVYGWYRNATAAYEVRVLDFSVDESGTPHGSEPRVVHPGGPQYAFWLYGWREDDEVLVGLYRPDNSTALGFLSLSTGAIRVLKSFEWADAHAALSPGGDLIAYDLPPGADRRERDIYLMASDGTGHTKLIEGQGRDVVLGWVPSDGSLLFYSEGSDPPAIWRLPISGGRPSGPPEPVRLGIRNLEPLGFAGEEYYFGYNVEAPQLRAVTIDVARGRLTDQRALVETGFGPDAPPVMAWSPDGEYMVHEIQEGPARTRFVLSARDGTEIKEWVAPLRLLRWMLRWTPDGDALVLSAQDHRGRAGFFRMELATGELHLLRRFDNGSGRLFSLSPDGRTLYFTLAGSDDQATDSTGVEIVAHDMATGRERVVHRVAFHEVHLGAGHWSPLAVTPDGDALAYPETGPDRAATLWFLPLSGGEPRALLRLAPPGLHEIVGWDPEGTHLLFLVKEPNNADSLSAGGSSDEQTWSTTDVALWRVSRLGGDAERIGVIPDYAGGANLHPDGRTLAFRSGRPRGEIWALEGAADSTRASEEDR